MKPTLTPADVKRLHSVLDDAETLLTKAETEPDILKKRQLWEQWAQLLKKGFLEDLRHHYPNG